MRDSMSSSRNGRSLAGKGLMSVAGPFLRANCDGRWVFMESLRGCWSNSPKP